MTELQFPITKEEALSMNYTLAGMAAAERALRLLWQLVERVSREVGR
jgi:hypothetical protein